MEHRPKIIILICFIICFGLLPYLEYKRALKEVADTTKVDSLLKEYKVPKKFLFKRRVQSN